MSALPISNLTKWIVRNTLIIDDLADSGQTFRVMRRQFPQGRYVTVYAKEKGKEEVDLFARELPEKWIVFPWDVD